MVEKTTDALVARLENIVGAAHVLRRDSATRRFRKGYRVGGGRVLAVVQPASLLEQWQLLEACVAADKIIIMQAANTGLTGGSTPDGENYDREIVIINTLRLSKIRLIREGRQVICFPGATLDRLEALLKPLGREPHSVIGSSCIGASVAGGIANNSGGALVRRGPAYTELALFAKLREDNTLELVNHLGVTLEGAAEEILRRMDADGYTEADVRDDAGTASDNAYCQHVRDVDAATPARFNADPQRLFEASGCAGKLALFAVRLDTFPAVQKPQLFYIGTNDTAVLADIRRDVLARFKALPVLGEYIHKDAFDVAEKYGKDTFLIINWLGTRFLSPLFSLKNRADAFFERCGLPRHLSDLILQGFSRFFPAHLPKRMRDYRQKFAHHLLLEMEGEGVAEAAEYLAAFFANKTRGDYFTCSVDERRKALLHRFAVAGAGVRYRALHPDTVEDILAFDIALPRNARDWFEVVPADISGKLMHALYCGHFLCYVFHQDYIVKKGHDVAAIKAEMLGLLKARGAEYPAEHNVGHFYDAAPALKDFYQGLDPLNAFNPGIGKTSKKRGWKL